MSEQLTVVWSEPRTPWPAQKRLSRAVLDHLTQVPEVDVAVVPHLYDLSPDGTGVDYLRSIRGPLLVLAWLYPRAAFWLLDAHGIKGRMGPTAFFPAEELPGASDDAQGDAAAAEAERDKPHAAAAEAARAEPHAEPHSELPDHQRTIWCIDLRDHDEAAPLWAEVDRIVYEATGRSPAETASAPGPADSPGPADASSAESVRRIDEATRARWYPVVDYGRCAHCLECLNFCLFGVFDTGEDDSLVVVLPDQCRTGCPACARVCPSAAIMFPMHSDPAIAGDPQAPWQNAADDLLELAGLDPPQRADPRGLAGAEHRQALEQSEAGDAEQPPADEPLEQPAKPAARAESEETTEAKLDRLVDELDGWEQSDL